jgi:phage gpG-like protein
MNDLIKDLNILKANLHKDIMRVARVESEKFFKRSFDNEGFTDKNLNKWQAVKDINKKGKILTKTRALADTLKATVSGDTILINSPTKYAKIHNEGGQAGRGGSATIPKRQFIGKSAKLEGIIDRQIERLINKRLK